MSDSTDFDSLKQLKRIAEATERASKAVVSLSEKLDQVIEAAGGVEGLKKKLALFNLFAGK